MRSGGRTRNKNHQNVVVDGSLIRLRERQSAFHPHAQRNASRWRDARLQSSSFASWNQSFRPSPSPTGFAEVVGNDLPTHTANGLTKDCVGDLGRRRSATQRTIVIASLHLPQCLGRLTQ